MLQALGLDKAGATIYQAILAGTATDTSGLSAQTGLPEAQVDAALAVLAALNLIRVATQPRWEPVNPPPGPAALTQGQRAPLPSHERKITGAGPVAHAANPGMTSMERLDGPETLRSQVGQLAVSTAAELQVTVTSPRDAGKWLASRIPGSLWTTSQVKVQVLYHGSARDDPAAMSQAALLADAGFQVRASPHLPPVLVISDQQAALVPLDPADPCHGTLCIREPAMVAFLAALFRNAWDVALPLYAQVPVGDDAGISPREHDMLRHLATGLTVEAAARQLGISARTAGRLVATLMDKLGASSRLQAGYEATRRGLL